MKRLTIFLRTLRYDRIEAALYALDTLGHLVVDPYVNVNVRGHHLPGWGRLELWQWHLCNAYERRAVS